MKWLQNLLCRWFFPWDKQSHGHNERHIDSESESESQSRMQAKESVDTDILYVVLPYFNFCGFVRRRELFVQFVNRISKQQNIKIVVVEAIHDSTPTPNESQLPKLDGVYIHIRIPVPAQLWVKESLINLAVQKLPFDWKYMAWVDADITFLQEDWVQRTINALDQDDVVQMFQTCVNMGPSEEAMKIDRSFAFMHRESGHPFHRTDKYGHWHPGFAWACTHKAYLQMDGLLDIGILGSGDRHMALALIGHADWSAPGNIHPNYVQRLTEFQQRTQSQGLTLGYVPGTILHHWHGRLQDRKYRERWDILTQLKYDPDKDVKYTVHRTLTFTEDGERLREPIKEYFVGRKEDNTDV